jgi:soluble lytic murein transglycosylase-like protein
MYRIALCSCTAVPRDPVQLGLGSDAPGAIGIRHGAERRHHERRTHERDGRDRRRQNRRRARLRSLLFTALALLPHQFRHSVLTSASGPRVTTSIDSFVPVSPSAAYNGIIHEAALTYGVDPALIRSVMQAESGFDPAAVSRTGAAGLMQLMPDLAAELGVEHVFDPRENIMAGARYLRQLLDRHHGDVKLTIASYNAGPTAVDRYGRVPPFKETQNYVKRVTNLLALAAGASD